MDEFEFGAKDIAEACRRSIGVSYRELKALKGKEDEKSQKRTEKLKQNITLDRSVRAACRKAIKTEKSDK